MISNRYICLVLALTVIGMLHAQLLTTEAPKTTAATTTGNNSNATNCFSQNMLVELQDGSRVKINSLNYGDMVKVFDPSTNGASYSKFLDYLDFDSTSTVNFIEIVTEKTASKLEITNDHLIERLNHLSNQLEYVFAKQLNLNDKVRVLNADGLFELDTIVSINSKESIGAYAPLTESGTIVVNNVHASCYANIYSQNVAQIVFAPLRLIYKIIGSEGSNMFDSYKSMLLYLVLNTPLSAVVQF